MKKIKYRRLAAMAASLLCCLIFTELKKNVLKGLQQSVTSLLVKGYALSSKCVQILFLFGCLLVLLFLVLVHH